MKSDEKLDEMLWSMRWSAAIAPELSMIPGRSVFLCAPESSMAEALPAGIACGQGEQEGSRSAATTIHEHDGHFVYSSGGARASHLSHAELLPSLVDEDVAWLSLIEGGMPGLGGGDEDAVTTFTSNFSKSGRHTPRDLAIKHSDLLSCPELC